MTTGIYDIHVHLPDPFALIRYSQTGKKRFFMRILLRRLKKGSRVLGTEVVERHNLEVIRKIESSMLSRAVVLAFDKACDESGNPVGEFTCTNEFVSRLCGRSKKLLFGASIHPYRKDALQTLQQCVEDGACLVKWLPSAQNIDPEDSRCHPFYEMLASSKVPLLCHTGNEHILGNRHSEFNDPLKLRTALRKGVKVIAAHCGARLLLHERSYFDTWKRLALEFENCYGDVSAFILPTRVHLLKQLRNDRDLCSKVLFGSDYPVVPSLNSCLLHLGYKNVRKLRKEMNEFNRAIGALRELGMPDCIFTKASEILKVC
ncbi:MAG: hypothetical protein C4575_11280 [Desulforudis sp.]|jgi:hypothetical protein|nr:MAG: hypothetical protein C4575_11280 [Desulforudis sp.]